MWISLLQLVFMSLSFKIDGCSLIKLSSLMKVRAGVEMALIDAVATSIGVPLWRLVGGVSNTIITDITVQSSLSLSLCVCFSFNC